MDHHCQPGCLLHNDRLERLAIAILMLGGSLGVMLGFVGGGLIAEAYNWRIALISVGPPGLLLAVVMAGVFRIPGPIGALAFARRFDRLSHRGFQHGIWMLAVVPFVTLPFFIAGLLPDNLVTALVLFIIPGFAANYVIGPTLTMVQTLSPVQMRAVYSAILMLCLNLIGMGLLDRNTGKLRYFAEGREDSLAMSIVAADSAAINIDILQIKVLLKQAGDAINKAVDDGDITVEKASTLADLQAQSADKLIM